MRVHPIFLASFTDIFIRVSAIPLRHIFLERFTKKYPLDWEVRLRDHIDSGAELASGDSRYMHYPHHAGREYSGLMSMDASMLNALLRNLQLVDKYKDAALFAAINDLIVARNKLHALKLTQEEKFEMACESLRELERYVDLGPEDKKALQNFYLGMDESIADFIADDSARFSQANAMLSRGETKDALELLGELAERYYVPAMLRLAEHYRTAYDENLVAALRKSLDLLDRAAALGEDVDPLRTETERVLDLLCCRGSREVEEAILEEHRKGRFLPRDHRCFDACFRRLAQCSALAPVEYLRREVTRYHNIWVLPLYITYGCAHEIAPALRAFPPEVETEGWRILCQYRYITGVVQYSVRLCGGIGCKPDLAAARRYLSELLSAFVSGNVPVEGNEWEFEETCNVLSLYYTAMFDLGDMAAELSAATGISIDILAEKRNSSQQAKERLEKFFQRYCADFAAPGQKPDYPRLNTAVYDGLVLLAQDSPRKAYWESKRKEYLERFWNFCRELALVAVEDVEKNKEFFDFHALMVQRGMMDLPDETGKEDSLTSAKAYFRTALKSARQAKEDLADPEGAAKREKAARRSAVGGLFGSLALGVVGYFASKYVLKWLLVLLVGPVSLVLNIFGSDLLGDFDAVKKVCEWICIIFVCGSSLIWFISSLCALISPKKKKK